MILLVLAEKVKPTPLSFVPAFIWWIVTIVLLTLPGSDIPQSSIFDLVFFDKWVHIGMFGLLTLLLGYPFLRFNNASAKTFGTIAIAVILYGIAMEFVQKYFADERDFDVLDMVADSFGVFVAWWWLSRKMRIQKEKSTGAR